MQPTFPVALQEITCDPDLQPRVEGIDADHVQELEGIAETWPPLKVVKRGERYVLVDGFHRFAAAQNLGLERVPVEVLEAPADGDLAALAFSLNAAHGKPLTLSDRRAFAARLLRAHPDWSDREIGRRVGLVQPTVAKVREDLERQAEIAPAEVRKGRDGRSYPATGKVAGGSGITAALAPLANALERLITPAERIAQRNLVRYLERLAAVLEEQNELTGFETIAAGAEACRVVLGAEKAKELGEQLGWSARNILDVAIALGYRDEPS